MKVKFLIPSLLFFLAAASEVKSQDSLKIKSDSPVAVDTFYSKRRANKAALLSTVLPGAGQVFNKKYWKPPILYAGFVALGYAIEFNNRNYKNFRKAYLYRVDDDPATVDDYVDQYPDASSLQVRKDYYRRTRDLMWIIGSGVYILNIIDAYVDAHLADFDVGDDLSMHAGPGMQFAWDKTPVPSLAFTISLK